MKPLHKGIILAVVHLLIVSSLGAKMLYDRATRPRVWVQTRPVDPDLPIRGRYLALSLVVPAEGITPPTTLHQTKGVVLQLSGSNLVARPAPQDAASGERFPATIRSVDGSLVADLSDPVAFFLPEHAQDPSVRKPGEELWVEVTLPKKGLPRPIHLGVKRDGVLTPLEVWKEGDKRLKKQT